MRVHPKVALMVVMMAESSAVYLVQKMVVMMVDVMADKLVAMMVAVWA